MKRAVLLLVAAAALVLSSAPVQAQLTYLQNDDFTSGPILCYSGIDVLNEAVAAKFTAQPSQYPYTIDRISVLGCGGGMDAYAFRIFQDDGDTAAPGPVIYTSLNAYLLNGSNTFNEILLSDEGTPPIVITSGTIRVEISYQQLFVFPIGFGADVSGIQAHRNFLRSSGNVWSFAEDQGVAGDFILRLGIVPPGAQPSLSVFDQTVTEGDAGTVQAVFSVALSGSTSSTVTVDYATADGTATAPGDYQAVSGTLSFPPGASLQTVAVLVNGDLLDEPDETFTLDLSNPQNAILGDGQGVGTITDDDLTPSLSIGDVTVAEGDAGTTSADFTVTLSAASGQTVTANFATANGTATAGSDYVAASGSLSFAAGTTSQTVSVSVSGDVIDEPNETFFVNLSGATNATILDSQGLGTINDDDAPPSIAIGDVAVLEGDVANVPVTLSGASGLAVAVNFATADDSATSPGDYQPTSGTLSFTPGQTLQLLPVTTVEDALDEPDETFFVNLTSPQNATIGDGQGIVTILDDDGATSLSIGDVTLAEGNTGTTGFSFTVTLAPVSAQTVSVDFATADGTATAPGDYAVTTGTLSFAPGQTSGAVVVPVVGETADEPDETFFVNLGNPQNAVIGDGQGLGTITNDDGTVTISIADTSVREGANDATTIAALAVSLDTPSGQVVSVSYATADGTATAGTDFQPASGTLSFAPGATGATVTVTVLGDDLHEADEGFLVNLSAPVNAVLGDPQAAATIFDDDAYPELTHGQAIVADLRAQPGPVADADVYRVDQKPYASYEVVVDGVSGDLGAAGPALERLASDGATVLQSSTPLGTGSSRSLRFENPTGTAVSGEYVRVRGTTCTTGCGPEDVYRIRLYETTATIPRFNNSATQITVVALQNLGASPMSGTVRFWSGAGVLLLGQPFFLPPHGVYAVNTSTLPALAGQGGSLTITSDGSYGTLAGKAVSLEPATGFSFDSVLSPRVR